MAFAPPQVGSLDVGGADLTADYTAFVTANQQSLLAFAVIVCGDRDNAQDVLQNVLAKAYLKWDRIGADEMDTRAYLNRMVVNERNSLWRRAFRRHEATTDQVPEVGVDPGHDEDVTWAEVLKLPPRQRQVIALRFYADLSVEETAAALKCSTGTVKSQTHHAIATLRAALTHRDDQGEA